jgi:hypothetical protein
MGSAYKSIGLGPYGCVVEKFRVKSVGMRGLMYKSPNLFLLIVVFLDSLF